MKHLCYFLVGVILTVTGYVLVRNRSPPYAHSMAYATTSRRVSSITTTGCGYASLSADFQGGGVNGYFQKETWTRWSERRQDGGLCF